jgi:hypothetical protein
MTDYWQVGTLIIREMHRFLHLWIGVITKVSGSDVWILWLQSNGIYSPTRPEEYPDLINDSSLGSKSCDIWKFFREM